MYKLFSTIFLVLFLTCTSFAQCFIKGNLIAYKGDSVYLISRTINNFFSNITFNDCDKGTIKDEKFETEISCNRPVFIKFLFSGFPIFLIATPGDSINMNIDFTEYERTKKVSCKFSGANAKGNQLFNDYNSNPTFKFEKIWSILKESNKSYFIQNIKNEIINQLKPFENLYIYKDIDSGFYNLVTSTIKTLLLFETIRRVTDKNQKAISFSDSERVLIGNRLFEFFPPLQNNLYYGLLSYLYADIYFSFNRYKRLNAKNIYDQTDTTFRFKSRKFTITGPFSYLVPIKENRLKEYLFGTKILGCLSVGAKEFLKDEIDYFMTCFPQSPYNKYINKFEKKTIANTGSFRLRQTKYFDKWSAKFIDSTSDSFHTFDFSSIPELRDKVIFVDIWATWCGPCLKEMEYNYEIDSFLYVNDMQRVYVSIDQPGQANNWMKLISKLNLGGYHILAGEKLQKNLIAKLNIVGGVITIPRYLIVKNDIILVSDAFRPSNISSLKEQINKIIKKFKYK